MIQCSKRLAVGAGVFVCLLSWLAGGCSSSEGGVVGSGISSAVQGNVIEVDLEIPVSEGEGAEAEIVIAPVLVSIDEVPEVPPVETTDAGSFELRGDFAGTVTVRFREVGAEEETLGTRTVDVAAGSTVFLPDVEIRRDQDPSVHTGLPKVFNLPASVQEVSCDTMTLRVQDDAPAPNQFVLRLLNSSQVVGRDGSALECQEIAAGMRLTLVEGVVESESDTAETFVEVVKLVVNPAPDGPQPAEIQIRRRGVVLRSSCEGGVVHFEDANLRDLVRVEFDARTRFDCIGSAGEECGCPTIQFGDVIEVDGVRRMNRPEAVQAIDVLLIPNVRPDVRERVSGNVDAIDCATGLLAVSDIRFGGQRPNVEPRDIWLLESTTFTCRAGGPPRSCECEDVGRGDRVDLEVRIPLQPPGPAEAVEVAVVATSRTQVSGAVVAVSCESEEMMLETQTRRRVLVALQGSTSIELAGGGNLSCGDIELGEIGTVHGRRLQRPDLPLEVVVAERVELERRQPQPTPQPTPGKPALVLLQGHVVGVECPASGDGSLRVVDARARVVVVRLGAETEIRRGGDGALCGGIARGEHVVVEGHTSASAGFEVDALAVRLPRGRP